MSNTTAKRKKIKFLLTVLDDTYWAVSPKKRLARLKLLIYENERHKCGHFHEEMNF